MPSLNWIGKSAVVEHHKQVPFRLLEFRDDLSIGEPNSGNLLVKGDNLEALKALLPYYAGQVKCIYIDPPYNTGNENWVYNDAVNGTEMRDWLGKVVGGETEDLSRHDKWLCMMYPRLCLLREILSDHGAIFISIDDNEVSSLRFIMNEIFGESNFICTIIWQKMDSPKNTAIHLSEDHDYIVVYAKDSKKWRPNKLPRTEAMISRYKNPDNDPRGPWLLSDLAARNFYAQGRYPIETKSGKIIQGPPAGSYWRVSREKFDELDKDGRIWWGKTGDNRPGIKRFLSDVQNGVVPQTLWFWKDVGSTRNSKQELSKILQLGKSRDLFITPKPTGLITRILQIATEKNDLILDSFAGSGSTGHAVLRQNLEDGGNRHFILVEMEENIAVEITRERLKRVILGFAYTDQKGNSKSVNGLGSGCQFYELGEPLFDSNGQIKPEIKYKDLANHVFFIETNSPLYKSERPEFPLLGIYNNIGIYLLFNGILTDKSIKGGNVLTNEVIKILPKHNGMKVIYGTGCRISDQRLRDLGIVFKQIPYEIREK